MNEVKAVFVRGEGLRFTDAQSKLECFEALLSSHGVTIARGSPLEDAFLTIAEYLALQRGEIKASPASDFRDRWLRMLSLVDLVSKILGASERSRFAQFIPHLKLFGSASVDPSQNAPTDRTDQDNHKLFELLVGASCDRFCDALLLENPRGKETKTPDVTVTFDNQRWGIACKVLHSTQDATYRDRVAEGIRQIDRADVDRGIVLLNAKALVPNGELLPFKRTSESEPYEVFETDEAWTSILVRLQKELADYTHRLSFDLNNSLRGSRAEPLVAHYFQFMVLQRVSGEVRQSPFATLVVSDVVTEAVGKDVDRFLACLATSIGWGQSSVMTTFVAGLPR